MIGVLILVSALALGIWGNVIGRPFWEFLLKRVLPYACAIAIGVGVGVGELIARYRDDPLDALRTRPAILYLAFNGLSSSVALLAIHWLKLDLGGQLFQVLTAGFGAMGIFRSSLFTVRAGDRDVSVGPAAFLQIILDAADRAVDRERANRRAVTVVKILENVAYAKAVEALPTFCLASMQNVSVQDQTKLGEQIAKIRDTPGLSEEMKLLIIGLALMNVVGSDLLEQAVVKLFAKSATNPAPTTTTDSTAAQQTTPPSTAGSKPPKS